MVILRAVSELLRRVWRFAPPVRGVAVVGHRVAVHGHLPRAHGHFPGTHSHVAVSPHISRTHRHRTLAHVPAVPAVGNVPAVAAPWRVPVAGHVGPVVGHVVPVVVRFGGHLVRAGGSRRGRRGGARGAGGGAVVLLLVLERFKCVVGVRCCVIVLPRCVGDQLVLEL